jgi:hypothetical protein
LAGLVKTQSKKQQELENGIFFGIGSERDLDSDFDLSGGWQQNVNIEL